MKKTRKTKFQTRKQMQRKRPLEVCRQFLKTCPLLVCLLVSWGAVEVSEAVPKRSEEFQTAPLKEPAAHTEDVQPEADGSDLLDEPVAKEPVSDAPAMDEADKQTLEQTPADTVADTEAQESHAEEESAEQPKYLTYEKTQTDSPWYTDPGKIPLTTVYAYETVDDDYFDDAVFIGDSRIVGMYDYSGLTNATFFAKTGLTVYNLLDDKFVEEPESGQTVSVSEMMQKYTYGKIYLMVGINELGTGGTARFQKTYAEVLEKLRTWQPDAVIYVQSILGVSPKKDASDEVFNNTNIRDKNCAIAELTDGIHIFYLNIQEIYEDENHALSQDLTFDDVHLYAQHYDKWVAYLKTHAVEKGDEK